MKVKVYCPCGAKFEFEVEPVHGRMPVPIGCPVCGADATGLANEIIQQQLAPDEAAQVSAEPPPEPAPHAGGLRIARGTPPSAPVSPTEASADAAAPRPVPQRPAPAAAPAWQQHLSQDELSPWARRISLAAVALLALAGAAWFWYAWFARDPKIVYSLDFSTPNAGTGKHVYRPDAFYELIGPNRLVTIKNQRVTLMDVTQQISLWSVPVPGTDVAYATPHVTATTNDIWVAWSDRLMRIDRQTGTQKPLSLPDPILQVTSGKDLILVVSGDPSGAETVTQISLPDGTTQTEAITALPQPKLPVNPVANNRAVTAPDNSTPEAREGSRFDSTRVLRTLPLQAAGNVPRQEVAYEQFDVGASPFFDAGQNAVWFQTRLLEQRQITLQAMKQAPKQSVLDSANVTASQGLDLAEEMANNSQRERTGGVDIVDVSRYQVTLHRLCSSNVPDWTGEVIGPPEFVPLKTVDLIVAGTNLLVFDKNNKKLWDAKLTYPTSSGHDFKHTGVPCLETGGALYFADKGMLTRFDPVTGDVRWRLPSVGISAVQADEQGKLYLDTTTLGPDSIQYSQQVNLRERDLRVIMQVDPANGNILWRSDFPGSSYHCLLSGKFLYSTRVWQTQDALRLEEGPDTHFTIKLLERGSGKMIWNHVLDNKSLVKAEVQENWILLQFEDQVSVLKFFSL